MSIEANPAKHCTAVTPSDTADLPNWARALLVGTAGTAYVDTVGDGSTNTANYEQNVALPLQAGYNPVSVRRVRATGLTAATIVALW